ncbi:hypothetical protein [Haloarchaeobius iranensis]|uniref:hypothetical protein n=1 Tax=Haloarchaeobius iranensis TaxID=996166 RepID=UPI001114142D|nr:hypothetical protein [Haloarchaeobius iranensis]
MTLASVGIPVTTSAARTDPEISAEMVEPGQPETAKRFVRVSFELGDTQEVRQAYRNLSDRQLRTVREAVERFSEVEVKLETEDVTTNGIPASKTASVNRQIAGETVHSTEHTVELELQSDGETVINASHTSSGSDEAPLWHHKGLDYSDIQVVDGSSQVDASAIHKYEHSVGGQVITTDLAYVGIFWDDGSFSTDTDIQ